MGLKDPKDSQYIIDRFQKDIHPDAHVEAYATHDWVNNPYSKGGWACWGPGYTFEFLQELQKRDGRVFFASADWADGWRGFVDGAIEQGQQAAQNVMALLRSEAGMQRPKL